MFFSLISQLSAVQFYSSGHRQYTTPAVEVVTEKLHTITVCHVCFCHHVLSLVGLHVTSMKRVSSHTLNDVLHCYRRRQTALSVVNSHVLR